MTLYNFPWAQNAANIFYNDTYVIHALFDGYLYADITLVSQNTVASWKTFDYLIKFNATLTSLCESWHL